MNSPAGKFFSDRNKIIGLFLLLAAVFCFYIPHEHGFMCDERIWRTVARQWLSGIPPYTGLLENKSPGIFYVHLLSLVFGDSPFFGRILAALMQTGAAFLVFLMAGRLAGTKAGLYGLAAFIILVAAPSTEPYNVGATESFMLSFTALGFWLYFCR